jgi:superfamily II DNA helicase RecQ
VDGNVSTISQAISKHQVHQAQKIISNAANESEEVQKTAICKAIQLLYPYPPRDAQQDALHHLIYRQKDLVLIAKTSFGKSMILQAVSVLQDKKISIVILPLDQIGKEQAGYIERIGGRPCFINADNISNRLLRQISDGKYTHLLMSPELAVSEKLRKTVIAPKFKDQLALIVIDEAHLVQQWGVKFRTDYARLHLLRTLLGRKIPWFACSATLDSLTLDALIKGVDFEPDIKIQVELLRARFFATGADFSRFWVGILLNMVSYIYIEHMKTYFDDVVGFL